MKNTLFISVFTATIITAITACGGNSGKAKSDEIPTDSMAYSIVKKAKGACPNPLFAPADITDSAAGTSEVPPLRPVYEYDVVTLPGQVYKFERK